MTVRQRRERVIARDIAEELGISVSTVSRAFTEEAVIASETRSRVLAAARRHGYRPDPLARSLTTRRSRIAAIVVADITNPFYPEVLAQLIERLQERDLQTMLFSAGPGRDVDDSLPTLLLYHPDVAIVLAATLSSAMVAACRQAGTPVVLFNRYVPDSEASAVCCDNREGGRTVARALAAAGQRRLGYIAGQPDTSTNLDRLQGFAEACAELGLPAPLVEEAGSYTYEAGYAAAKRLLLRERPEALFCANDILALGALDAARRELGLQVPDQLSVVGFDDISMASWPSYSLTTIRQPVPVMIDRTMEQAAALLRDPETPARLSLVPGILVRRASARLEAAA